jgi:hypothetical protein
MQEVKPNLYTVLPDSFIKFEDFKEPLHTSLLYPHPFGIPVEVNEIKAITYKMETSKAKFLD